MLLHYTSTWSVTFYYIFEKAVYSFFNSRAGLKVWTVLGVLIYIHIVYIYICNVEFRITEESPHEKRKVS